MLVQRIRQSGRELQFVKPQLNLLGAETPVAELQVEKPVVEIMFRLWAEFIDQEFVVWLLMKDLIFDCEFIVFDLQLGDIRQF